MFLKKVFLNFIINPFFRCMSCVCLVSSVFKKFVFYLQILIMTMIHLFHLMHEKVRFRYQNKTVLMPQEAKVKTYHPGSLLTQSRIVKGEPGKVL